MGDFFNALFDATCIQLNDLTTMTEERKTKEEEEEERVHWLIAHG